MARDHFSGSWGALGASGPHGPLRHALMAFWISLASFPTKRKAFCTSSSTTYVEEEKCVEASRIRDAAASRCSMNSSQLLLRRAMAASISFSSIIVASCRKLLFVSSESSGSSQQFLALDLRRVPAIGAHLCLHVTVSCNYCMWSSRMQFASCLIGHE